MLDSFPALGGHGYSCVAHFSRWALLMEGIKGSTEKEHLFQFRKSIKKRNIASTRQELVVARTVCGTHVTESVHVYNREFSKTGAPVTIHLRITSACKGAFGSVRHGGEISSPCTLP